MWHELTPNCAFELPMFCRNVNLFLFREFWANSRSIYVLFLGKVMPNFCMTLMHARIFIINLFYYYRADVHDGQWNDGGQVVAVGGAGHERK